MASCARPKPEGSAAPDQRAPAAPPCTARGWLAEIRDAADNSDPRLTGRAPTVLRGIFGK